jgi:hypothetical protein
VPELHHTLVMELVHSKSLERMIIAGKELSRMKNYKYVEALIRCLLMLAYNGTLTFYFDISFFREKRVNEFHKNENVFMNFFIV